MRTRITRPCSTTPVVNSRSLICARTAAAPRSPTCSASPTPRISRAHSAAGPDRSEEHTSELQSLMRISYAVFCLKKKNINLIRQSENNTTQTLTYSTIYSEQKDQRAQQVQY